MIEATGSRQTLVVRRMRCLNNVCRKIHHELPDILVPYKIHAAEILEKIIEKDTQEVPLEESTIHRIRSWFYHRADALVGGLIGVYMLTSQTLPTQCHLTYKKSMALGYKLLAL